MNLTNQAAYQTRHPTSVLLTPEFPHCAAALNALFGRELWARDEDMPADADEADTAIDIDVAEDWTALRKAELAPRPSRERGLRWRAPVETFKGPCSLWTETHDVKAAVEGVNAMRERMGLSPLPSDDPSFGTKSYTAYKLLCEVDRLTDDDFQVITRIADRHNCSFGVEAMGDKVLLQLAFVR